VLGHALAVKRPEPPGWRLRLVGDGRCRVNGAAARQLVCLIGAARALTWHPQQEQNRYPPVCAPPALAGLAVDRAVPPPIFFLLPLMKLFTEEQERRLLAEGRANAGREESED
jgi:hypothetical protein